MRLIFVSGVSIGGAPRSTMELAVRLAARGHDVVVVLGDRDRAPKWFDFAESCAIKGGHGRTGRVLRKLLRRVNTRAEKQTEHGVDVTRATIAANAYRRHLMVETDAVIANSLNREEMSWIADDLSRHRAVFGLYLRESHAVTHMTVTGLRPDLVLSNAEQWAREVRPFTPCEMVPSIVDLGATAIESSRRSLLLVNPIDENRVELLVEAARRCPDIPVVLQKSWEMDATESARLHTLAGQVPNVEIRERTDRPAEVYRDARVLFAPYQYGRPRVLLEAQNNGIPVLALDHPPLTEAIAGGGVMVPPDVAVDRFVDELRSMWSEPRYSELVSASRVAATRAEVDPEQLVTRIEEALQAVIDRV